MILTSQKGFGGIDESLKIQNTPRFASSMVNLKITDSGSLTKRPDVVELFRSGVGSIKAVWRGILGGNEIMLLACDNMLYRALPSNESLSPEPVGYIGNGECVIFEFGDFVYIKSEDYYSKYDGNLLSYVSGYSPLVAIGCSPSGEGEIFEQINLLTSRRRQRFSCDGESLNYRLAEKGIEEIVYIMLDDSEYNGNYVLNSVNGTVTFDEALPRGLNNLEICYSVTGGATERQRILGCKNLIIFGGNSDGRVFLWGNGDFSNYRFHSELASGVPSVEYFPVNAYTVIGNTEITCIVQQYDRQLIFTKDKAYYSYCELRDDGLGNLYSSFPVFSLNDGKGCLIRTPGCVIDNRPITLCHDGLNMWESTSIENEKNAVLFSMPVNPSILNAVYNNKQNIKMFDFQANRELYFICNSFAYIYNYGNSAWYLYDGFYCDTYFVYGTKLYFSKDNRLYWFGEEAGYGEDRTDRWMSAFMTLNSKKGRSDIIGFECDLFVQGPVDVGFEIEESGSQRKSSQSFSFGFTESGNRRISFRPSLKRAMPFRLTITESGKGSCAFHNVTFITREKERSDRNRIL